MKTSAFIIFVSIVTIIYGLVNFYIYTRAMQALPSGTSFRTWFTVIFWVLVSAYVVARFLERAHPCNLAEVMTWIGSIYLGIMVYSLLVVIGIDIIRLADHFFHIFPAFIFQDYQKTKLLVFAVSCGIVIVSAAAGFVNARLPRTREVSITVDKKAGCGESMKIVMVSDVHMGTLIAKRRTNYLVRKIMEQHPDLILFAGDAVDEDIAPVIRRNLGGTLSTLKSIYGVYGVTGNHEYIGGAEKAVKYLTEHGIKMLRDTAVLVNDCFYLVGRDDRDKPRFTGKERKPLEEIMAAVDRSYPVILMDHQPFNLGKAVELGVDLQVSGHTHHGQLWPFNYITRAIYEVSTGYKQIGNTHFYVSTGFGSWGPPMRLGNRPEIVVITIHFNRNRN